MYRSTAASGLLALLTHALAVLQVAALSEPRSLKTLSTRELSTVVNSYDPSLSLNIKDLNSNLHRILIPRASGTSNNTAVRAHIVETLRGLQWQVEEDSFDDDTPYGRRSFTNIIATHDPRAPTRFVLAAHFDSKYFPTFPENQFLGATDSAAPCAMLLDIAKSLNTMLNEHASNNEDDFDEEGELRTTLQLIFFDGEEAFKDWTSTDSISGARHLAGVWESEFLHQSHPKRRFLPSPTVLATIENLVLLDLLGAPDPRVRSYYPQTAWLFDRLIDIESRLNRAGLTPTKRKLAKGPTLQSGKPAKKEISSFFVPREANTFRLYGHIEDDHIPFLKKGVDVLHVIPEPFPSVWHTLADDASALDLPTMRKWSLIFRVLTVEYLRLKPPVTASSRSRAKSDLTEGARVGT